jgi:hypothetical protein
MTSDQGTTPLATHDPERFVSDFLRKLGERRRHVAFLFGAGTSKAAGLPDIAELAAEVGDMLEDQPDLHDAYRKLIQTRNIEEVLTRARLVSSLLEGTSETFDSLDAEAARRLDRAICSAIRSIVSKEPETTQIHRAFAGWLGRAEHDSPVEVFTINYDLLIERGLEEVGVPYFDGFVGVFEGVFRADLVETMSGSATDHLALRSGWVRVWKLHGSVSWRVGEDTRIRRMGTQRLDDGEQDSLAIYPSVQKYEESRRVPFVTLFDRLRKSLETAESITVTCGYSFGDQHINELLFDAAERFPRSEVVALFRGDIPEPVAARAKGAPNLTAAGAKSAVWGGEERPWSPLSDALPFWNTDRLTLGDFRVFVSALLGVKADGTSEP